MVQQKSNLEKEIEKVSKQLGIPPLEKYGTTPGVGNCWYEACTSLMKLYNIREISAQQLREEVIDNMEQCENFENVCESFKSNGTNTEEFKKKHRQEGTFTDEDGVMVMTTAIYLGITLRIFSNSNTKKIPYTEFNGGKSIIFHIFQDRRGSGHYQSLRQPKTKKSPHNRYSLGDSSDNESDMDEILNKENNEQEDFEFKQLMTSGKLDNVNKRSNKLTNDVQADQVTGNNTKTCEKCEKTFPNIESLREHHLRFDYIQCTFCHKEFSSIYDLEDHEEYHRDAKGYYKCEWCSEKIPKKNYARLHTYCHNSFEVLEEIKEFEINLFQQMMDISPDIIAQSKNVFRIKEEAAAEREERIKKENEEIKRKEEAKKEEEIKALKREEEAKKEEEQALKEKRKQEEALEIKEAKEKKASEDKRKQEELVKKTEKEALEIKRRNEEKDLEEKRKQRRIYEAEEEALEIKRKEKEFKKRKEDEKKKAEEEAYKIKRKEDEKALEEKRKQEEIKERKKAEEETSEIKRKKEAKERFEKQKSLEDAERREKEIIENIKTLEEKRKQEEAKNIKERFRKAAQEASKIKEEETIEIKNIKSNNCWNCFDSDCPSNHTANRVKRLMEKKKLEAKENKASIDTALKTGKKINENDKASLLKTMSRHKEEMEKEKKDKQCALYKIPPKNTLREQVSKETMEKNISIAKKGIAETIEYNSKISRGDAMEILELIQDVQEELHQPKEEKTSENSGPDLPCPAACDINLDLDKYIDHVLECEKQIEDCWRCGEEYKNNNVHRSLEKHSTPEQRFACMTCMRAHATRIRIVGNHKYICLGPGTRKDLVNEKTPEFTGEQLQQAYDNNKAIKKLLKEDFRKRNRKHRKNQKNNTNPIKIILTILGLISLIYAAMFIIMKSTEKTDITKSTIQNTKSTKTINTETKDYEESDLRTINEEKWKTKKKYKELHEYKESPTKNREENAEVRIQTKPSSRIIDNKVDIKQEALKNAIENSIVKIMDTHECSENMAQKAINEVFNERGQKVEKEVIQKIKNMKETEEALRNSISDAQTAAGIIQNNREVLENKLKKKLSARESESHKVITKKYTAPETGKADLSKVMDSTSKPSSPVKTPVSGRTLSSRDPRKESAEAKQASDVKDAISAAKPASATKNPVSGRTLNSEDPRENEEGRLKHAELHQSNMKELKGDTGLIQDLKFKGKLQVDLIDLAYIKNYNGLKSAEARQAYEVTDSPSTTSPPVEIPVSDRPLGSKNQVDLIDLAYIKNYNGLKSAEAKQAYEVTDSPSATSHPVEIPASDRSLGSRDPRRKDAETRQAFEVTESPSAAKPSSSIKIPNTQATFLLIQNNMGHMLISEENLEELTSENPQIITELGIQITESNQNKLRFTETTVQSKQSHNLEGEVTSETTFKQEKI